MRVSEGKGADEWLSGLRHTVKVYCLNFVYLFFVVVVCLLWLFGYCWAKATPEGAGSVVVVVAAVVTGRACQNILSAIFMQMK